MAGKIKISKDFKRAFQLMNETDLHLFLTGRAGTGKSTLLTYFRKHTKKQIAILAPTGVAALNVKGQTIHSFFGFKPSVTKETVRRAKKDQLDMFDKLEAIVIDEISMVRADLLDCVDRALRLNRAKPDIPFGGVQMIFIGDLYQLPPVLTDQERFIYEMMYQSPYFFSAYALGDFDITVVELKKVYRQKDKDFVNLLNRVRDNQLLSDDLDVWNGRHDPFFDPEEHGEAVHLTTTNKMAQLRNDFELRRLEGEEWEFKGVTSGEFDSRRVPAPATLKLKAGSRVMFTCNDVHRRWVNGSIGTVVSVKKDRPLAKHPTVRVELTTGDEVRVEPHTWNTYTHVLNQSNGDVETSPIGSYTQFPLMLAWAVTIHKSQGKTFDKVLVDVGYGTFAHGQLYVALSRCTTLKGITLRKPFRAKDVILDDRVVDFVKAYTE